MKLIISFLFLPLVFAGPSASRLSASQGIEGVIIAGGKGGYESEDIETADPIYFVFRGPAVVVAPFIVKPTLWPRLMATRGELHIVLRREELDSIIPRIPGAGSLAADWKKMRDEEKQRGETPKKDYIYASDVKEECPVCAVKGDTFFEDPVIGTLKISCSDGQLQEMVCKHCYRQNF